MPKKRTKKQKIATEQNRYRSLKLSLAMVDSPDSPAIINLNPSPAKKTIAFSYDPTLVIKDLKKTVFISTLILLMEVLIHIYLK
jgi:hypothetical protein